MKTYKLLTCFFLLLGISLKAQNIHWTSIQEEPSAKADGLHIRLLPSFHHLDKATKKLYSIRQDGYLTVFDEQMKPLKNAELSYESETYKNISIEKGETIGDALVLIFSAKKKGDGDTHIFARKLDKNTLALEEKEYWLASYSPKIDIGIDDAKTLAHNVDIYDRRIHFMSSPNQKLHLLVLPGRVSGREESCHVSVFDSELNVQWSGGIQMTMPDGQLAINEYEIDDLGNVYIAGEDIHNFQRGVYSIFIFKDQKLIKEHHISHTDGKRLFDMSMDASTGVIQCAGFYADEKNSGYNGVAHIAISPTSHEILSETYTPFADNIQELFMSNSEKKKKARGEVIEDVEIEDYTDKACVATPDGGIILLAEYNGIGKVHIASSESYTFDGYYAAYGDIMAVKLDANGKTVWSHIVKKAVQEIGEEYRVVDYASFKYLMKGEGLLLYFNEVVDKRRVDQVLVSIDKAGKKSRKVLESNEGKLLKGDVPFAVPVWTHKLDEKSLLLYNAYSENEYRLGVLGLD